MKNNIILKLTKAQFNALIALAEEMALTVGMTSDETAKITNHRIKLVNKALQQNKIDCIIKV